MIWGGMSSRAPELVGEGLGPGAQHGAGGDAADDRDGGIAEFLEGAPELGAEHVHACGDEGGGHVGLGTLRWARTWLTTAVFRPENEKA